MNQIESILEGARTHGREIDTQQRMVTAGTQSFNHSTHIDWCQGMVLGTRGGAMRRPRKNACPHGAYILGSVKRELAS